jgi:ABC-type nickel/cobalt efflux system permease component RcnA
VITTLLGLLWGLAQGVRHALEPDHLAALSTLVAERRSARSAASYALAWGVGHALVLLVVGGALQLVRARLPDRAGALFELAVAAMLVGLGARALGRAYVDAAAGAPVAHAHAHARRAHAHAGPADHVHVRRPIRSSACNTPVGTLRRSASGTA